MWTAYREGKTRYLLDSNGKWRWMLPVCYSRLRGWHKKDLGECLLCPEEFSVGIRGGVMAAIVDSREFETVVLDSFPFSFHE